MINLEAVFTTKAWPSLGFLWILRKGEGAEYPEKTGTKLGKSQGHCVVLLVAGQCKKIHLLLMEDFSLRLTKVINAPLIQSQTDLEVKRSIVTC